MQQQATISTEAISHLSQMAALYGYELKPLHMLPAVVQMNPGTTSIKALIKKKTWTKEDAAQAITICKNEGIGKNIKGLFNCLKFQL